MRPRSAQAPARCAPRDWRGKLKRLLIPLTAAPVTKKSPTCGVPPSHAVMCVDGDVAAQRASSLAARDFTPVCTTELGEAARRKPDFDARGVKLIALSVDAPDSHKAWAADIKASTGHDVPYPIIADPTRELAIKFDMLDPEEKDLEGLPVTVRSVFIIGPDKKVKLMLTYPPAVGRNFDEIVRCVDALQTASCGTATPVNWQVGEDVMVPPPVSSEEAAAREGFRLVEVPSGKEYMRYQKAPTIERK